jgi:AcrR family transcriptional regulator
MAGRRAPTEARPTNIRRPAIVRRRLVIEAARTVIARRGMAATRMRDVAAAAEVSLGTLTYHFAGIDELLGGVIEAEEVNFFQPLLERAGAAATGAAGLDVFIDGLFNDDERTREHWLLWLDYWTLASHDPKYGRWQDQSYAGWRAAIADLVERGRRDGSLVVADAELATTHFMVLVDGVAAQAYLTGRDSTVITTPAAALMRALAADLFRRTTDA